MFVGRVRLSGQVPVWWSMGLSTTVRERSTAVGAALIGLGVLLLLALRFWASPLARYTTGREPPGLVAFLGVGLFLVVVGTGITLFLWEPPPEDR